jgi:hypothetical protein
VSRSVLLYLDDMLLCCQRVIEYARDLDLEGFLAQHMVRDAILHNIQTILSVRLPGDSPTSSGTGIPTLIGEASSVCGTLLFTDTRI